MNSFAEIIKIPDFCGPSCTVYSVRQVGNYDLTEFEYWLEKNKDYKKVIDEFNDIIEWLSRISQSHGAKNEWFRAEDEADALPPPVEYLQIQYEYNLRLYCLRLSDSILVLFNGGVKTQKGAEFCPVVRDFFKYANEAAKEIKDKIRSGQIEIIENELTSNGNTIIIND